MSTFVTYWNYDSDERRHLYVDDDASIRSTAERILSDAKKHGGIAAMKVKWTSGRETTQTWSVSRQPERYNIVYALIDRNLDGLPDWTTRSVLPSNRASIRVEALPSQEHWPAFLATSPSRTRLWARVRSLYRLALHGHRFPCRKRG